MRFIAVIQFFLFIFMVLSAGLKSHGANYSISSYFFDGIMIGAGNTDWIDLQDQAGANPTICLSHGGGVNFDIAVFNDGEQVCSDTSTQTYSCCSANTSGHVRIKVWSRNGSGSYSVTIRP